MSKSITLLIDGDVYAYQAASATEQIVTFDGVNFTRVGSLAEAIPVFEDKIQSLLNRFKTTNYVIALTDGRNFRKDILPSYKANRDDRNKPMTLGNCENIFLIITPHICAQA